MPIQVWIGLVHVKPREGHEWLGKTGGAYAATIALSRSVRDFAEVVGGYMETMNLHVIEIEDIEPLSVRAEAGDVDPELLDLARQLRPDAPVAVKWVHRVLGSGGGAGIAELLDADDEATTAPADFNQDGSVDDDEESAFMRAIN